MLILDIHLLHYTVTTDIIFVYTQRTLHIYNQSMPLLRALKEKRKEKKTIRFLHRCCISGLTLILCLWGSVYMRILDSHNRRQARQGI